VAQEPYQGKLLKRIAVLEKDAIIDALKRSEGIVAAAARDLGITPRMVRYKIEMLRIDYPKRFGSPRRRKCCCDRHIDWPYVQINSSQENQCCVGSEKNSMFLN
jgi:hypothetical protein